MSLVESLKALPKEYAIILGLKIVFALLATIGTLTFIMFLIVGYLYVHDHSFGIIITAGFLVWAIPLGIIAILYYIKLQAYRRDAKVLRHLASKEAISSISVYLVNKLLRKLKPVKKVPEKV